MPPKPQFFATPSDWRTWLEKHYASKTELWVGFYKHDSGRPSITWPESVDGALCFGWIDGIRKSVDAASYMIRFTPRKPGSVWSEINVKRANELSKDGLMHAAGLAAFAKRKKSDSPAYSPEQRKIAKLPPAYEKKFCEQREAWEFFQSLAPGYQRLSSLWVISAKKEETKLKRLEMLIDYSARRQIHPALARPSKPK
jgi:uncharacterized protein YdeI (YjbR/CyaY-like superfamily)